MTKLAVYLSYREARAAIGWLRAIGFETTAEPAGDAGSITHAELRLDEAVIMVASFDAEYETPALNQADELLVGENKARAERHWESFPRSARRAILERPGFGFSAPRGGIPASQRPTAFASCRSLSGRWFGHKIVFGCGLQRGAWKGKGCDRTD